MVELYGKDAIEFERKAQLEMENYYKRADNTNSTIGTFCGKCREVICRCKVYEKIISEIKQKMIDSRNPNNKTKRTGDYRIGLKKAIEIIENNLKND